MPNGQWPELGARGAAPGTAHRTQQISARLRVAVRVVARRNLLGLKAVGLWEAPAREVWVRFGRLGSSVVGVGRGRKARQASGMKNP